MVEVVSDAMILEFSVGVIPLNTALRVKGSLASSVSSSFGIILRLEMMSMNTGPFDYNFHPRKRIKVKDPGQVNTAIEKASITGRIAL